MIAWGTHGDDMIRETGRAVYNGHGRIGCPRCCGTASMTPALYRGNRGVMRPCCIECEPEVLAKRKRAVEKVASWRKKKEGIKAYRAAEARKYREKSGDKVRAYRRSWYEQNKDMLREYRRNYIKQNPGFNRAASARHRALVLQRTVSWADLEEIKRVYKDCPDGMVVDHIIPLRGKTVSGLHVAPNLQYLTFGENSLKSNKFEG